MPRGRRPLPTETKRQRGTLQPCRENPDEPRIEPAVPAPLPGLDPMQRRAFDRLCEELLAARIVTRIDGGALSSLAIAECRMRRASRKLRGGRGTVTDEGKLSAWATELDRAQKLYRQMLIEFGLTPSARTKVKATPVKPKTVASPREERRRKFFGGGKAS